MKKLILLTMILVAGMTTFAQTKFRDLSWKEAIETAKREGKLVFVDFYTDWCGPCKVMSRDVFPQKQVGNFFNAKFVCLKLNAEKEGRELAKRFCVSAYPTFIVVDTDEKVRVELKGSMDADKFIARIEDALNPGCAPDQLAARYAAGDRTPDLVNRYALYLMEQKKEPEMPHKEVGFIAVSVGEGMRSDWSLRILFCLLVTRWICRMRSPDSWWITGMNLTLRFGS